MRERAIEMLCFREELLETLANEHEDESETLAEFIIEASIETIKNMVLKEFKEQSKDSLFAIKIQKADIANVDSNGWA